MFAVTMQTILISLTLSGVAMPHVFDGGYIYTEAQCEIAISRVSEKRMTDHLNKGLSGFNLKISDVMAYGCIQDPTTIKSTPDETDS